MASRLDQNPDKSVAADAALIIRSLPQQEGFVLDRMDASSTAHAYFQQAETYRSGAETLVAAARGTALLSMPISNLYFHAIEMYLKCYLSLNGMSVEELDGKYNRNFRRMRKRLNDFGLKLVGQDKATLEYFVRTPLSVRTRYLSTAYYYMPTTEDLGGLCDALRDQITASGKLG
jgi:hypothetical protein